MTLLVAVGFLEEGSARKAARHLRRKVPEVALDGDAVAVVSRDERGTVHVTTSHQGVVLGRIRGAFWPPLIDLLCLHPLHGTGPDGDGSPLQRAVRDCGAVDVLRGPVLDMLQCGTSVLFVAVGPCVPRAAVADTARRYEGTAVSAALTPDAELRVVRALQHRSGDGQRAPGADRPQVTDRLPVAEARG